MSCDHSTKPLVLTLDVACAIDLSPGMGCSGVAAARVLEVSLQLAADPGDPRHASNLANALWLADRLPEALSWARWATANAPVSAVSVHPLAWRCLGNVLLDCGRYEEADRAYRRADPEMVDSRTQFNRSKVALGLGDYALAWRLAEHRLCSERLPDGAYRGPWWQGWPEPGVLTIWSEQGLGDTLQFLRWIPLLMDQGKTVTLMVQAPLQRLVARGLSWLGPRLTVLAQPTQPVHRLAGCHGSLLSLPWRLKQPMPAWAWGEGYLRVDRLAPPRSMSPRRVGLMWGAGPQSDGHARERDYRRKSVPGQPLRALVDGLLGQQLELVKLQVGPDREPAALEGVSWAEEIDPQADLLALAELMLSLDLVITVDTAAAHLAGALGCPAWLLLPWAAASRWGRGTVTTPWYPSLRLWRQPRHGDWMGLWPSLLGALQG